VIDVYAPEGTFANEKIGELLKGLAECFLRWTDASEIPIARQNTGAFFHSMPAEHVTAGGIQAVAVRIDVKVPEVVLSTIERRRGFVSDATAIVASLSTQAFVTGRTWITISNTADGGWGIDGHGLTNAELDDI
jgi:hypothetical protein